MSYMGIVKYCNNAGPCCYALTFVALELCCCTRGSSNPVLKTFRNFILGMKDRKSFFPETITRNLKIKGDSKN
jgi:hypothetical protein